MKSMFRFLENEIPRKTILKERVDDDGILIVLSKGLEIFYFNDVASDIFSFIDGKSSISDIYSKMKIIYEVEEDELKNDLTNLIRDFQWSNLIFFS